MCKRIKDKVLQFDGGSALTWPRVNSRAYATEQVQRCGTPLSPDCFTGWGRHDAASHNAEARRATDTLLHNTCALAAADLCESRPGHAARPLRIQPQTSKSVA